MQGAYGQVGRSGTGMGGNAMMNVGGSNITTAGSKSN